MLNGQRRFADPLGLMTIVRLHGAPITTVRVPRIPDAPFGRRAAALNQPPGISQEHGRTPLLVLKTGPMPDFSTQPYRILLVDDHALFREGIAGVLAVRLPDAVLLSASDAAGARPMFARERFDLVLLDLALGRDDGLSLLREWRARAACPPIVILSASAALPDMNAALAAGARGFIPKTVSGALLVSAIELVRAGGTYVPPELLAGMSSSGAEPTIRHATAEALTPRQLEVLALLAEGRSNKEIARKLDMADGTVRTHVNAIFRALDASNRTQAVMRAQQLGWL